MKGGLGGVVGGVSAPVCPRRGRGSVRGQLFPLAVLWGKDTSLLIMLRRAKASGVLFTLGAATAPLTGLLGTQVTETPSAF